MAWKCDDCNMKFEDLSLFETHKKKFCVCGKVGDPSELHRKASERNLGASRHVALPHIRLTSSLSAPSTPGRPPVHYSGYQLSPGDVSWEARQTSLSAPATPDNPGNLSLLEKAKIEQLKLLKARAAVERNTRDLEEKLLLTGANRNQVSKSLAQAEQRQSPDERVKQLIKNHEEQLVELKQRHARLEQEKDAIQGKMDSLNLKSSHKRGASPGHVERQLAELEGLRKYLEYKDKQHRSGYDASLSRLEQLQAKDRRQHHHTSPASARSNHSNSDSRTNNQQTTNRRDPGLALVPSSFPLYGSSSVQHVYPQQMNVLNEINALKSTYLQQGGSDPAVLAQFRDLEIEALATQTFPNTQRPVLVDPAVQQQLMAYQLSNQRLEQEIQMLKEDRQLREKKRSSPEMTSEYHLLKEEHMKRMVALRQESEILKQQAEIEKVKKELKELRGEPDTADNAQGVPFVMSESGLEKLHQPSPYDPKGGFAVLWDFILGLPASYTRTRIAAGIYQGAEVLSDVKVMPVVGVNPLTRMHYPEIIEGGAAVLSMKHPFPSCPPSQSLSLVVELQATTSQGIAEQDRMLPRGWLKVDLFDATSRLISGRWKIPFRVPPVKVHLNTCELNRISQVGQAELYLRLVNARDMSAEEALSPQPAQHFLYKFPRMEGPVALYHQPTLFGGAAPIPPPSIRSPTPSGASASRQSPSVPLSPSSDNVLGFQLDLLMGAVNGEVKMKITSYDRSEGQVLKAENGRAVLCATQSVKQAFLAGVYSFGLQEARFRGVPWDQNSSALLRLYLRPASRRTPLTGDLMDDANLAAWTVIPLAVEDRASRGGRSSQGRLNSRGQLRLNTGTHWLPLFHPPVPDVKSMQSTPTNYAEDWNRYGKATVALNIFSPRSPPLERPSSPTEFREAEDLPADVWIRQDRPAVSDEPFQSGSGFDLYVDGARFLPDSVTVSKVVGKVFDKGYKIVGPEFDVQAQLDSDIFHPSFNVRVEHRDAALPPSAILLIKVYTVDRVTRELCSVGFAFLPIFLDWDTNEQPSPDSGADTKVALNVGAHQVRIYNGRLDVRQPLHESVSRDLKPVPCATLLMRIRPAARDNDGLEKKTSDFREKNWVEEGLVEPRPQYSAGAYSSVSCEPSSGEYQIFHSLVKREPITVREAIHAIGDQQETAKLKKDKVIESWIKTRLTRRIDSAPADFDLTYVALYHPLHGLKVSVDAAQNLGWSNLTLATYCFSPPAAFYRGTREDGLHFATHLQFSGDATCPVWSDGLKGFPRRAYHKFLVLIVHLHEVTVDVSQGKSTHGLHGQAWTALPVFHEGFVLNGSYQLPLYTEEPPESVLNALQTDHCQDVLSNFRRRKVINLMEGSSVFVRLCDARRAEELPPPKAQARQDFLPKEHLDRYSAASAQATAPLASFLPPHTNEQTFSRDLRARFIMLTNRLLAKKQSGIAR